MSAASVRMAQVERSSARVPVRSMPVHPAVGLVFVVALALIAAALAYFNVYPSARYAFAALAVFFIVFPLGVVLLNTRLSPGVVRIDDTAAALRFVAPTAAPLLFLASAIVGMVPGVIALVDGLDSVGRTLAIVGALSAFWLLQQLWALRLPAGLTLDERGIRGVRGSKPVDLSWDDLASASVTGERGLKLRLHLRPSGSLALDPTYIGSDPNVVAPVIDFFLKHPEHRAALATPMAALALVEETTKTP